MAESTLSLAYADFAAAVGRYLSFSRTSTNWSTEQTAIINRAVDSGYAKFLRDHAWTFAKDTAAITTASGTANYDLPDDYGSFVTELYYPADEGWAPVARVSDGEVRNRINQSDASGHPTIFSVKPKAYDGTGGQRFEVCFYPEPDAIWVLTYWYNILTLQLRTATPYPLGGMAHGETILASIVASAELENNDEIGVRAAEYQRLLAQSIKEDQKSVPAHLGYNRDNSDMRAYTGVDADSYGYRDRSSTIGGVTPD